MCTILSDQKSMNLTLKRKENFPTKLKYSRFRGIWKASVDSENGNKKKDKILNFKGTALNAYLNSDRTKLPRQITH